MNNKIRIGIVGYGNLGKGVEASIKQQGDMELVAIFSRRDPETITPIDSQAKVAHIDDLHAYQGKVDVMLLCGGSATDLPEQTPAVAKMFNTVDSFDTHANIPAYFETVNEVAELNGKTSIISVGWDPGLFSLNRVISEAVLPVGDTYTFWGKGLSQGHSDAVRQVKGVKGAVQYTLPSEEAMESVRAGENPELAANERHKRECYVVAEEGADKASIEKTIKEMPNYFEPFDTTVNFITEEELARDHADMPHGGFVIRSGETGENKDKQIVDFGLTLGSNPGFTSSVLTAYARAAYRLNKEGQTGAKTIFDVAPGFISKKTPAELRKGYL